MANKAVGTTRAAGGHAGAALFVVLISTANDTCSRQGRPARERCFRLLLWAGQAASVDWSTGRVRGERTNWQGVAGVAEAALAVRARIHDEGMGDPDERFRTGQIDEEIK
ncbi:MULTISPECIES: hypothetical protein [Burkholderia cepacia complex]|uniref:hypothetical protein n=1 Tax=Burkholderia cepacia complex TaxID=87882 RepID=UPI00158B8BA7|nr:MULTISPECIES: hypothetical protein [Burkholderia cepacia complex]MDN7479264.1 hypothetical protein [Burkholderia orbicola]MDN7557976.1 hypothetical protein [Burkholderia orbicola]MDS0850134.1 hypothetical protein [Burkholderia cenocepacia]